MSKKLFSIFLAFVLVFGMLPIIGASATDAAPTFPDIPDNWATEALESAVANGILTGYDDGRLWPNNPMTRAQMATIITRAFGAMEEGDISAYSDVKSTDWFADSIAKAVKMGVMQGYDGKMSPNDNITREQAFVVLARALKLDTASVANKSFLDSGDISDWAKGHMFAMVNAGYIQGSDGKLNPQANITRAEFAQVMYNVIKQYIKVAGEYTTVADGNVMVNVPGVTLKNVTINGDLIVGDGVGDGNLTLENVAVKGRLVARGGGINSIMIKGGSVEGKVVVAKVDGKIRVSVEGGADVEVIVIDDGKDDVVIEGTVGTVQVNAPDVPVAIQNATVSKVEVNCEGAAKVTVSQDAKVTNVVVGDKAGGSAINVAGQVTNIETAAPETTVTGTGTVSRVTAKEGADGTSVSTPNTVVSNQGATGVTAGDKEVPQGGSTTSGGTDSSSGGGGAPVNIPVSAISVEGDVIAGSTLTAKTTPTNATVTYQWQRADAGDGIFEDITDATSKTYRLVEEDKGQYIRVIVEGYSSYRGTKTSAAVGPVGTPDKSIYKLSHTGLAESYVVGELIEVEDKEQSAINTAVSTAITGLDPVKVTLAVDIKGDAGYEHVRIAPVEAGENIQFWAKDTSNNWYDINVTGWGPPGGFALPAEYDVTTDIYVLSDKVGTYELDVNLVNVDAENAVIAEVSGTVTVREKQHSVYGFELKGADQEFIDRVLLEGSVIVGENGVDTTDLTPVGVTLKATTIKELGYDNVKVLAPEVTQTEGSGGKLQFWAYSAADTKWFDAGVHGWGSGFAITPDYDVTTDVYVFADTAGTYEITFKLVDLDDDQVIATITKSITVLTPAEKAVKDLGLDMEVTPINNGFKARFDKDSITIPDALAGYKIDVFISLDEPLSQNAKVTILWNGNETEAKDVNVTEKELRLSDLVLGGIPAEFTTGAVAEWTVLIGGDDIEDTVKGTIRSIISKDGFKDELLLLAEGSIDFIVDTKAPTATWDVALVDNTYYTVTLEANEDLSKFTHHTYMSGSPLNIEMDDDSWKFKRNDTIMDLQDIGDIESNDFTSFAGGKYSDKSEDEKLAIKAILTDGFKAYYLEEGNLKSVIFVKYDVNDKTTFTLAFEPTEKTIKGVESAEQLLVIVQNSKYSLVDTSGNTKTVN